MRLSRRVLANACWSSMLAATLAACPASAQFYDSALRSLDLSTDPISRSPRLLGMGRLSLAVDDPDYRLNLWDFAGNPTGLWDDDSTSTLQIRPGTASSTSDHLATDAARSYRQDGAARGDMFPIEAFHRNGEGSAYGGIADLSQLRYDTPISDDTEQRRSISAPGLTAIFNAPFPWLGSGRMHYGLTLSLGQESLEDQFRAYSFNAAGEFIGLNGDILDSPNRFVPDEYLVVNQGVGGALSYDLGKATKIALGLRGVRERIRGSNNATRSSAELRENRPYGIGQATLIGRLGDRFEYGADGHAWTSSSQQDWVFSTSAGVGAEPLAGRGKLLEREEEGTSLRTRARWRLGAFSIGGSLNTNYSKVKLTPPGPDDLTSLNLFLDQVYHRQGADTLSLPDSVVANELTNYGWGFGGGVGWTFHRGMLGAEYHWARDQFGQAVIGLGPKRIGWDVRSGLEYRCTEVLTGRVGYGYRWTDRDDLTQQNESAGHSMTLGFGIHPAGVRWGIESGYSIDWSRSDFGDPAESRGSRQNLALQVRWAL